MENQTEITVQCDFSAAGDQTAIGRNDKRLPRRVVTGSLSVIWSEEKSGEGILFDRFGLDEIDAEFNFSRAFNHIGERLDGAAKHA